MLNGVEAIGSLQMTNFFRAQEPVPDLDARKRVEDQAGPALGGWSSSQKKE
jgi:hypothetical protein